MVRLVNFSEGGATRIGVEMSDGGDIADITKVSPPPDFVSFEQLQNDRLSPTDVSSRSLPHDRGASVLCWCTGTAMWPGQSYYMV